MRKMKVTYTFRNSRTVPTLRLCGDWLTQAGFEEGTRVSVGLLILTASEEEAKGAPSESLLKSVRFNPREIGGFFEEPRLQRQVREG